MSHHQTGSIALRIIVFLVALGGAGFIALKVAQARSDGPLNDMLPGGELKSGTELSSRGVVWPDVLGEAGGCSEGVCAPMEPVALQLVSPATSRWTGIMVRDDKLYVPCDLGFMWGRFEGTQRWILNLIYVFKRWHEDAMADGRAVIRIEDTRYTGQLARVTDPTLVADLKTQLEDMARSWVAPAELGPPPSEGPRDIWFFEFKPR